jgi:catechol 2,3-dioxygenase-like lactoylglutathione lyase family enzyme
VPAANHHVALRVADLDRAVRFYEEAFDATAEMRYDIDGDLAAMVSGGPPGTAMTAQSMTFDGGGAIELFQFRSPARATRPVDPWEETVLHFAIEVDDVDAALARAEAAGATSMWPEVLDMGGMKFVYLRDPDHNVIELIDGPMEKLIALTKAAFAGDDDA